MVIETRSMLARQVAETEPPVAAGAGFDRAFGQARDAFAQELDTHWSGALARLSGPAADPVCLAELWAWLVAISEAYTRDALSSQNEDWRQVALARSLLFGMSAMALHEIIIEHTRRQIDA
jgi:hypothetical protein